MCRPRQGRQCQAAQEPPDSRWRHQSLPADHVNSDATDDGHDNAADAGRLSLLEGRALAVTGLSKGLSRVVVVPDFADKLVKVVHGEVPLNVAGVGDVLVGVNEGLPVAISGGLVATVHKPTTVVADDRAGGALPGPGAVCQNEYV